MPITTASIKELREQTGAGPLDCKLALERHAGDLAQAVAYLRERGLAKAARVGGRETNAGLVIVGTEPEAAWAVEARCETDFVARTEAFKAWAHQVAELMHSEQAPASPAALLAAGLPGRPGVPVSQAIAELKGRLGENITLRAARFTATPASVVEGYIHAGDVKGDFAPGEGRVGVLIELGAEGAAAGLPASLRPLAHDLALHVAATGARYASPADLPATELEAERERLLAEAAAEHKPEAVTARIVAGRLEKYVNAACLLPQPFVRDDSLTVAEWLKQQGAQLGLDLRVRRLARFEAGT